MKKYLLLTVLLISFTPINAFSKSIVTDNKYTNKHIEESMKKSDTKTKGCNIKVIYTDNIYCIKQTKNKNEQKIYDLKNMP